MKKSELKQIIREEISNVIFEIGDSTAKKYDWDIRISMPQLVMASFETESGVYYRVNLHREDIEVPTGEINEKGEEITEKMPGIAIVFTARMPDSTRHSVDNVVNKGEIFKVMATIVAITKKYLKNEKVIEYSAVKKPGETIDNVQRDKLYQAFIKAQIPGVKFKQRKKDSAMLAILP